METYKFIFTPKTPLTKIPDSQTIFGAFCQGIKDLYGECILEQKLKQWNSGDIDVVFSSLFPNGLFPMPLVSPFISKEEEIKLLREYNLGEMEYIQTLKKIKKLKYIDEDILLLYTKNEQKFILNIIQGLFSGNKGERPKYVINDNMLLYQGELASFKMNTVVELRNKVDHITGNTGSNNDGGLFYAKKLYFNKALTEFACYVKVKKEVYEWVEKIFDYLQYIGIGGKKTIGLNSFTIEPDGKYEFTSSENTMNKLLLSKYIPRKGEVDFENSMYKIGNYLYIPNKEVTKKLVKKQLNYIEEGSLLNVVSAENIYGSVFETINVSGKTIYHNGLGFLV